MNEHRKRIVDDFSRHLTQKVQDVLKREMRVAGVVFDQPEIAMIILDLARGTSLGWVAHCLMVARPEVDKAAFFDDLMGQYVRSLLNSKDQVLRRVADPAFREEAQL